MAKARERQNDALMGGDQRYLPAVDRGSQRRYIRDYIDARRNVGDVMLFVMLAFFIFYPCLSPVSLVLLRLRRVSSVLLRTSFGV